MEGLTLGRSKDAEHLQLLYLPSLLTLTLRPNLAQREAFSELPVPPTFYSDDSLVPQPLLPAFTDAYTY